MDNDVNHFIGKCDTYRQNKWDIVLCKIITSLANFFTLIWISMDFNGGPPRVQGKGTIMVLVDRLTKYAHLVVLDLYW